MKRTRTHGALLVAPWDYLIVTASNDAQAAAYEAHLNVRQELGLLAGVRNVLVVPDTGGKRIGSGGSTILCLREVLQRELPDAADDKAWTSALEGLRILIVHAGGDSRRLPAYAPCGKIFVPVPGESDSAIDLTLFDRQIPTYLALPGPEARAGQVVITAGDVLLLFDPSEVRFDRPGVTGLGCRAAPEQASHHGVYCTEGADVRLFLQKPSPAEQTEKGAVDRYGQSVLDVGVLSFDANTAVTLLKTFGVASSHGKLTWSGEMGDAIASLGLDFYREVCCAMGTGTSTTQYVAAAGDSGSKWDPALLGRVFQSLNPTPFGVQVLRSCGFLHFGTTRQLITSGLDLIRSDEGVSSLETVICVNSDLAETASLVGTDAWLEGARLRARLTLGGANALTGVDIDQDLSLPSGLCLDVLEGRSRRGDRVWFVRCYGVDDGFKEPRPQDALLLGRPLTQWLDAVGAKEQDVWSNVPEPERSIWNARLFPAEPDARSFRKWLWMPDPLAASQEQRNEWLSADRYSLDEIAAHTDHDAFRHRRWQIRARIVARSLRRMFRNESGFSAAELAHLLQNTDDRSALVAEVLAEAHWHFGGDGTSPGRNAFVFSRIIHTLGSALAQLAPEETPLLEVVPGLDTALTPPQRTWLDSLGLTVNHGITVGDWTGRARSAAFDILGRTIVASTVPCTKHPVSVLRSDEIVWGRAPARLDLGGGWTDTPPYTLERGGCVINAAVNLNGQPPIQVYARVIKEPVIRIGSIDLGARIEITELADLLDFRRATGEFALVKAALALSGLSPEAASWPAGATLRDMLALLGGGIELTTLAAIPKGSGLGTSSIMGAVVLAVIQRVIGTSLSPRRLFQDVLRIEQALTTGGGWQDQIGGGVGGVKVITTEPGLVPDASIHYVPSDVLDPKANDGVTLLYYTGITRLAKNILQEVVGNYLNRDRVSMTTLSDLHRIPSALSDAMARRDLPAFGQLVAKAWQLNKQLDPHSSNEAIEALLERIRPHVHGAKLLGAGGGGFLLMVCQSPAHAGTVREMLEADPPNDRARFFEFDISREGLVVTVC